VLDRYMIRYADLAQAAVHQDAAER